MALWSVFKKKRKTGLNVESRWVLSLQDNEINLISPDGDSQRIQLETRHSSLVAG